MRTRFRRTGAPKPQIPTLPLFELPGADDASPGACGEAGDGHEEWWATAVAGVHRLAATGMAFQAYDLRMAGVPEPPRSAAQWGALFASLAREGVIVPVGYGPSPRPTTRSSAARIWRGAAR
ncbi:hypothetical protein [Actinomadura violacea]|uniref:Uncharacterized protein n=1 Tax=Actinomadura violacea TaxID=2819934 RepID=A0ABS3S8A4_9ACTN|nr:hypothetical protein [Actinomadura violacea]MBO2464469.1 hypothetical protein [Actinomadura violacea]